MSAKTMATDEPLAPAAQDHAPLPQDWEITQLIKALRERMPELAQQYSVTSLAVFGSYVRNEQEPGSDLDVLVAFAEPPSLLEFIHLAHELTDVLGVRVDLVTAAGLRPTIRQRILAELVPV